MTMFSFRLDEPDAHAAQAWAERLGIDRSELLREALRTYLARLASEQEAASWDAIHSDEGTELALIADWGPAEDWSDWADAAR